MRNNVGYASWKGTMDVSSRENPVFVYADTTWKAENLDNRLIQCMILICEHTKRERCSCAGREASSRHSIGE